MPDGLLTPLTLRSADALVAAGLAAPSHLAALREVQARYATAIPPTLKNLIETPDDPIGRQFIPSPAELNFAPHELADPIGDEKFSPVPGIVHRYPDRVLLKPLLVCPVYCRFCFRREQVGPDGGLLNPTQLAAALDYIRAHPELREVVLTGGDPLLLSPRRLTALLAALDAIPHLEILRIHSRVPVATPETVTPDLLAALATDKPLWLVLHANHAREFSPQAATALRAIQSQAITILGQSVLLRGVNDSEAGLENLFRAMLRHRIKPYYLHQLDPAPGTSHFAVPIAEGQRLLAGLRGRISGLAWPTYVLDIEGGHGKVPIGPTYLLPENRVRDPWGQSHPCRPSARRLDTPPPFQSNEFLPP
jgi:lysine 2,3-aminomutase